jgi:hypothetical protein
MDPDADPGGPKIYGSYGSGSATLFLTFFKHEEQKIMRPETLSKSITQRLIQRKNDEDNQGYNPGGQK